MYSQNLLLPIFCIHNAASDLLLSGHNNQIILSLADSIHSLTTRENCKQTVKKKIRHFNIFGQDLYLVQLSYIFITTIISIYYRTVENPKRTFATKDYYFQRHECFL